MNRRSPVMRKAALDFPPDGLRSEQRDKDSVNLVLTKPVSQIVRDQYKPGSQRLRQSTFCSKRLESFGEVRSNTKFLFSVSEVEFDMRTTRTCAIVAPTPQTFGRADSIPHPK